MNKVKNEIAFLKNKAEEQKAKVMQDSRVKQLENNIRWFKNESSKLAKTYDLQKKEIQMMKSKRHNIVDDNKFLKDQAKGCKRQNNILRHALEKNKQLLHNLKSMNDEELRMELLKGTHSKEFLMDPTQINKIDQTQSAESFDGEDEESVHKHDETRDAQIQIRDYAEGPMREIAFHDPKIEDDEASKISDAQSYQKTNDYVSYGLDYTGAQKDPQKVDVNLPVKDYVYQLLCNPKWTDDIFKAKMIEYQYHKDRPIEKEITKLKRALNKSKILLL